MEMTTHIDISSNRAAIAMPVLSSDRAAESALAQARTDDAVKIDVRKLDFFYDVHL